MKGKIKVVVTSHGVEQRAWEVGLEDAKLGRAGGPSLKSRLLYPATSRFQSRLALSNATHVFCLNEQDRDFLQTRFHIPGERITRIFPAAALEYSAYTRDYHRFRRILFAGTWLDRKGKQDAVKAFEKVAESFEFAALGAGVPAETVLASFPAELRNRVKVLSANNDAEGARAMAGSDCFLLPSTFEGTPLTLMEAMHSGLPIVTTDVCGMRDVIRDNGNGLLVPVRSPDAIVQAIHRLAEDRPLRERLGSSARREAVSQYTWKASAQRVWDVYRGL